MYETRLLGGVGWAAENDCYRQKQQEMASWKRMSLSQLMTMGEKREVDRMNPGHMQKRYLIGPIFVMCTCKHWFGWKIFA